MDSERSAWCQCPARGETHRMKPLPAQPEGYVVAAMEERAHSRLQVARELLDNGHFDDAVSRAYYAAFHAATLLFYCGGQVFSSHAQLVGAFNKEFVSTHLLPDQSGRDLHDLFELRQSADYDIPQTIERDEAAAALHRAEDFVSIVIDHARAAYPLLFDVAE